MDAMTRPWDYLIVTASNDAQSKAYESQLAIRRQLGLLADFGQVMVVPDPLGKRIGSGGSTLLCLMQLLQRELKGKSAEWAEVEAILRKKRVLIIHAGGDSRRVPAYGPCGKIFVPVPGENSTGVGTALFDKLLPKFIPFPSGPHGAGQVVVAAGDALLQFNPAAVQLSHAGLTEGAVEVAFGKGRRGEGASGEFEDACQGFHGTDDFEGDVVVVLQFEFDPTAGLERGQFHAAVP